MFELQQKRDRKIGDGIYDVTDIPFIDLGGTSNTLKERYNYDKKEHVIEIHNEELEEKVKKFIEENPDWVLASAYATEYYILFAKQPPKFTGEHIGWGFNYGSTNLLIDCPRNILILAEDD